MARRMLPPIVAVPRVPAGAVLALAMAAAPARGGVIASGIPFIPPALSTADPNRSIVVARGPHLVFNDGTTESIMRMSPYGGPISPLVVRLGAPLSVVVRGGYAYSSSGAVVFRSSLDGATVRVLVRTAAPAAEGYLAVDDVNVYYETYASNTWTIWKIPVAGGTSTALISTGKRIRGLASDGFSVYWAEELFPDPGGPQSSVRKIPVVGGAPVDLATGLNALRGGLVLDSGELFFADVNFYDTYRLFKVQTVGGPVTNLATVTSADLPTGIAVDAANVYWSIKGLIDLAPRGGGGVVTLVSGLDSPAGIAVAPGQVFWSESLCCATQGNGIVKTTPTAGGSVTTIADGFNGPGPLTVDSTRVYWVEGASGVLAEGDGRLRAAPLAGGAIRTIADAGPGVLPAFDADASYVYFDDRGGIKKVPLGGGPVEQLTAGGSVFDGIQRIVTDGAYVYWITGPGSGVARVPVNGGPAQTLGGGFGPPGALAVDATSVYWVDHNDTIFKVPKGGGATVTLASGLPYFSELVGDGTSLFFVEQDSGAIRRMSVNGGAISTLGFAEAMSQLQLTLDQQYLYWIGQASVGRVPKLGGAPTIIAGGLQSAMGVPNGVAADGQGGVYWTDVGHGTISASAAAPSASADLSISMTDGQPTALPGFPVTYTITVSNAGPARANGAAVVDEFLASALNGVTWTCAASAGSSCASASGSGNIEAKVDLPAGGSATFRATGTLDATESGTLTNYASVFPPAGIIDPNPANDEAADVDAIVSPVDLSITNTDGLSTAVPDQTIVYTIVASNAGPKAVRGATVSDAVPAFLLSPAWTCVAAGGAACTPGGTGDISDTVDLPVGGTVTYTLTATLIHTPPGLFNTASVSPPAGYGDTNPANNTVTDTDVVLFPPTSFFTVPPCRVADTRRPGGPSGGPALAANTSRTFPVLGECGIPSTATAIAVNVTVVGETDAGDLRVYPAGGTAPSSSTINFVVGKARANNAVIPLGVGGQISVRCDMPTGSKGQADFLFDVTGYFQ